MEKTMINLMDNILNDEDMRYISKLESKLNIDDDLYPNMNDIKLFLFKKGLKAGMELFKFCDEGSNS